jgi:hypothetical protein
MDTKLETIMERVCRLGRLLPNADDVDINDDDKMAEIQIVHAEFENAEAVMWARMRELTGK